jgi:ELWxxDGT repeat protein
VLLAGFDNNHGDELWRSDGTVNGTKLLKDIIPGSQGSNPVYFTLLNQKVFFKTEGDTKLWSSNGTANGTKLVPGVDQQATIATIAGIASDKLYFIAWDASNDVQLYRTKGNASSTVQLTDDADDIFSISGNFAAVNGNTYFTAITLRNGKITSSLYQSNGMVSGTMDIYDAVVNDNITDLIAANGSLYFIESNGNGTNRTLYSYTTIDGIQQLDFFASRDDDATILLVNSSSIYLSLNGTGVGQEPYVYSTSTDLDKAAKTSGDLLVYPNPTSGNITIQNVSNELSNGSFQIVIRDLTGRIVYRTDANLNGANTLSIQLPSSISNGIYLLTSEMQNQLFQKLIDVER